MSAVSSVTDSGLRDRNVSRTRGRSRQRPGQQGPELQRRSTTRPLVLRFPAMGGRATAGGTILRNDVRRRFSSVLARTVRSTKPAGTDTSLIPMLSIIYNSEFTKRTVSVNADKGEVAMISSFSTRTTVASSYSSNCRASTARRLIPTCPRASQ